MMQMAIAKFPEEYAIKKKAIGPNCKLFFLKSWNSSAWSDLTTTECFIRTLKSQMNSKGRVDGKTLTLKLSFGKAKNGDAFSSEGEVNEYIDETDGQGIIFSSSKDQTSPFERRVGNLLREENHNNPIHITELISRMYKDESSKLYYGFLNEHINSFKRIIAAHNSVHKCDSIFVKAIAEKNIPSNEEIEKHLINVFHLRHSKDIPGGYHPEKDKFPPTNANVVIAPPYRRDWIKNTNSCEYLAANDSVAARYGLAPGHMPRSIFGVYPSQQNNAIPKLIGITFKVHGDTNEVTAFIRGNLSAESTMQEVLDERSIVDKLLIDDINESKFLIQKKSGTYFTCDFNEFHEMKVYEIISIANISDEYLIEIKERNEY